MTPSPDSSPRTGHYVTTEGGDWLATIRQSLPVLPRVLGSIRPTWVMPSVCAIEPDFLSDAGIRIILWDVDGTLTHRHGCEIAPHLAAHLERLLAVAGLRHAILSNCGESRFRQLAALFPALPVVKAYGAADGPVALVRTGESERWIGTPRGVLRPLRKPDAAMIECALQALETDDRSSIAMVGDQCLTDVAAANLAGIRSIKVPTLAPASFPTAVRALQLVDRILFTLSEARGRPSSAGISSP